MTLHIDILGTGSSGNCYVLQDSNEAVILDAGVHPRKIMKAIGYKPMKVKAILVTHFHGDHDRYINSIRDEFIPNPKKESPHKVEKNTGFEIIDINARHDVPNNGYILSKDEYNVLYLTDTAHVPAKINGLTNMLIECNYSESILAQNEEQGIIDNYLADRIRHNHLSLERLEHYLSIIDKSSLRSIILCHLSDRNSDANMFAHRIERACGEGVEVHIAEKNKSIEL